MTKQSKDINQVYTASPTLFLNTYDGKDTNKGCNYFHVALNNN